MLEQTLPRLVGIEVPAGTFGDYGAGQLRQLPGELFCFGLEQLTSPVGEQALGRRKPQQLIEQFFFRELLYEKMAGRNIDPAYRSMFFCPQTDGTEKIILLGVQQNIVGERAGRDNAHDIAFYNSLCGLRIFDLLADGDPVACLEHFFQIRINSMVGQAGQWNRIAAFAPAGQSQAENLRAGLGVLIKGLVKIAHAKKQYAVRMHLFESVKLLHSRRQFFIRGRHKCRLYTKLAV